MIDSDRRPTVPAKVFWAIRVYWTWLVVRLRIGRTPLPDLVEQMRGPSRMSLPWSPQRAVANVARLLRVRDAGARCIVASLVGIRMLSRMGWGAELVIGLPSNPVDHSAHAWLEVDGQDIGPPPGGAGYAEIARY